MNKPTTAFSLGLVGIITTLVIDLIGIVAILVLDTSHNSPLWVWVTTFIAGLTAGAIIGTFSQPGRFWLTAGLSSLIAAVLFGAMLGVAIGVTHIEPKLATLYLIAMAFQFGGAIMGALGGYYGRPHRHDYSNDHAHQDPETIA